jgi:hypothetical protein
MNTWYLQEYIQFTLQQDLTNPGGQVPVALK